MRVTIIGGGFSGLTLAYFLSSGGASVTVVERGRIGGLLSSAHEPQGLVESAANGIWNSALVEEIAEAIGVEWAERFPERKNRYIFRRRPRRWPLGGFETLVFAIRFLFNKLTGRAKPRPQESVREWGVRTGGAAFADWMLAPALQGIYAGDATYLSASLILSRFFGPKLKNAPPKLKGTVAPRGGMGEFIHKLRTWLESRGVRFQNEGDEVGDALVLATSAWDAADLLRERGLENAADILSRVEALPLTSVTAFYLGNSTDLRGFGCLFPAREKFNALGVLFNSDIFAERSAVRSETWLIGGALGREKANCSDDELLRMIQQDRVRVSDRESEPVRIAINRWPKALPHYTLEWEKGLKALNVPEPLYLAGNYLGTIGLSRILEENRRLAERILKRKI